MSIDRIVQHDISHPGTDATHELRSHPHLQLHFFVCQGVEGVDQFHLLFSCEVTRYFDFHGWNSFLQGLADVLNHAHIGPTHIPDVAGHFFDELIVNLVWRDFTQGIVTDLDHGVHQVAL